MDVKFVLNNTNQVHLLQPCSFLEFCHFPNKWKMEKQHNEKGKPTL
jgi:hypothetical protein